jgi:hypothetical protein
MPRMALWKFVIVTPSDGYTSITSLCSTNTTLAIMLCVLCFEASRCPATPNRSDRFHQPVRPVLAWQPHRVFGLGLVAQPSNPVVLWWTIGNPANLVWPPAPLITWPPRLSGSTLVLRLNQESVHDFVSPFLPPCDPHLTPLATGSLEPSLHVYSTPGGPPI